LLKPFVYAYFQWTLYCVLKIQSKRNLIQPVLAIIAH
jgi:hypothetical protein